MAKAKATKQFISKLGEKVDGREFTGSADTLINIIKQTYKRNLGQDATASEVVAEATAIIESRVGK